MPCLADVDHEVGIDHTGHTDHTGHLSEVRWFFDKRPRRDLSIDASRKKKSSEGVCDVFTSISLALFEPESRFLGDK